MSFQGSSGIGSGTVDRILAPRNTGRGEGLRRAARPRVSASLDGRGRSRGGITPRRRRDRMSGRISARRGVLVGLAAPAAIAALVFSSVAGARTSAEPSWTVKLKDGSTFTLAKSIQDKVKSG